MRAISQSEWFAACLAASTIEVLASATAFSAELPQYSREGNCATFFAENPAVLAMCVANEERSLEHLRAIWPGLSQDVQTRVVAAVDRQSESRSYSALEAEVARIVGGNGTNDPQEYRFKGERTAH